jgi:hypothetical protein
MNWPIGKMPLDEKMLVKQQVGEKLVGDTTRR